MQKTAHQRSRYAGQYCFFSCKTFLCVSIIYIVRRAAACTNHNNLNVCSNKRQEFWYIPQDSQSRTAIPSMITLKMTNNFQYKVEDGSMCYSCDKFRCGPGCHITLHAWLHASPPLEKQGVWPLLCQCNLLSSNKLSHFMNSMCTYLKPLVQEEVKISKSNMHAPNGRRGTWDLLVGVSSIAPLANSTPKNQVESLPSC